MAETTLWPFRSPSVHETVSAIIRRHSTNQDDVRETALGSLDLSRASQILDLGCGFGFMAEAVARRADGNAQITGVDVWPDNEEPFVQRVAATGRRPRFVRVQIGAELPWPRHTFDIVVCSYSLYFFQEALPAIARVLTPGGLFLAVTHSADCFLSLAEVAGNDAKRSELIRLAGRFSAENGAELLRGHFADVERVDYENSLRFRAEQTDDLLTLLRFKLPFLVPGAEPGGELPEGVKRRVESAFLDSQEVVIPKSDAAFRCRNPL